MASVIDHYEHHLADHYSWLFGGLDAKCLENKNFFISHAIKPFKNGRAADLGCGSGFQSIPLAQIGFNVTSIDKCSKLLAELNKNKGELSITTINDDLGNLNIHCPEELELIICMGDTLTHLETKSKVKDLFAMSYRLLVKDGIFVLTYRDLSHELKELDRLIPVNSDEDTIFTCFLEYQDEKVMVNDLIYEKENGKWNLKKSFYSKLRIPTSWTTKELEKTGFTIMHTSFERGLVTIIAKK